MLETENEGDHLNVYADGDMIVSVSEEHDEIAVYRRGEDEPVEVHDLE